MKGSGVGFAERRALPVRESAATESGTAPTEDLSWQLIVLIGAVGGFLSGLLGIGGGTALVPLLVLLGGLSQRESHATSLATMVVIAAAALVVYGEAGRVDILAALALLLGSLVGARQGADLMSKAPERALKTSFGVFLLLAAVLLMFEQ
jgi:uncharacterized membrane protein YfcA